MNILVLEPYYGGSHKAFLAGLTRNLPYTFDLLTLPAHSWKWRMRLAAPHFAGVLAADPRYKAKTFDRIFCSSLVDVAALRGLLPPHLRTVPLLTYFHENQFAYPVQISEARDVHFGLTNLTTALASDRLAFNSQYNLDSFLAGCRELLAKMPDMSLPGYEEAIRAKATILPPGLDFSGIDGCSEEKQTGRPPVLVWNHRWEHDKNPELFFNTLYGFAEQGVPFGLIVLGESFRNQPPVFAQATQRLAPHIVHFGYAEDRQEYCRLLCQGMSSFPRLTMSFTAWRFLRRCVAAAGHWCRIAYRIGSFLLQPFATRMWLLPRNCWRAWRQEGLRPMRRTP